MSLGANVLERVLSEFQHSLNVQELMPCLRLAGLLTDDDCSEVAVDPEDPPESAVRMLTSVLKRKGPHCANMLLSALEQSVVGLNASHNIYFQLIECLQQELMMAGLLMGSSAMDQTQNNLSMPSAGDQNGFPFFPSAIPEDQSGGFQDQTAIMDSGDSVRKDNGDQHTEHQEVAAETRSEDQLPMDSREPVALMKYDCVSSPAHHRRMSEEDLRCSLVRESKAIRRRFTDFVLDVCNLLERCPTATIDSVRLCLLYFGCYRSHDSSPLMRATSITGLLAALHEYNSWFNYDLVSYLAERFCANEGKRLVRAYESQLMRYFQKLVFHCPPFSPNEEGIPRGFEQLEVTINWNFETCSLQDVAILKSTLCGLLQLQPHALLLRAVDDGCRISWAVPIKTVPRVIQLTAAKTEAFSRADILSLRVGAKVLDFPAMVSKSKRAAKERERLSTHSHLQQNASLTISPLRSNDRALTTCAGKSPVEPNTDKAEFVPGCKSSPMVQKSLPTLAYATQQAYGTHSASYRPRTSTRLAAKESLSHHSSSPNRARDLLPTPEEASCRDSNSPTRVRVKKNTAAATTVTRTPPSLPVLRLLQSPILRTRSYFQFYYTRYDGRYPIPAKPDLSSSTVTEALVPQGAAAQIRKPVSKRVTVIAGVEPNRIEDRSEVPVANQLHLSSSVEQSPASRRSITARRFESQSSVIKGPQSPSIVSIKPRMSTQKCGANDGGADASSNAPHSRSPEAAGSNATDMDVILSAASEARRRRGRRKRRTAEEIITAAAAATRDTQAPVGSTTSRGGLQAPVRGGSSEFVLQERSTNDNSASVDSLPPPRLTDSLTDTPILTSSVPQTQGRYSEMKDFEPVGKSFETLTSHSSVRDSAVDSLERSVSSLLSDWVPDTTTTWSTPQTTQSLQSIPELHSPEPLPIPEPFERQPTQLISPPYTTTSHNTARHSSTLAQTCKSVGFLWRLLGRANSEWPARLCVAAIQTTHFCKRGELLIRKGQQLRAMYRVSDRVFVESAQGDGGFVPYQSVRVSRKIYASGSKMVRLSYSQVYIHSPDGIDTRVATDSESPPPGIEMVSVQEVAPATWEDLAVSCGDSIFVLYCDSEWVYGIAEDRTVGFIPRRACRLTRKSQTLYRNWTDSQSPFQADFVIKFNEPPPPVLRRNMLRKPTSLTSLSTNSSRVREIMTVVRSYAPFIGTSQLEIRKGLRVKVLKSDNDFCNVVTKSGSSFWIPSSHLRPACQGDSFSGLAPLETVSAESLLIDKNTCNVQKVQMSVSRSHGVVDQVQHLYESVSPIAAAPASVLSPQQQPYMDEHSIVI